MAPLRGALVLAGGNRGYRSLRSLNPRLSSLHRFAVLLLLVACQTTQHKQSRGAPQRIISVVPNVTEMLFAFGLGDKVVAVGDYDRFPPEVEKKPRIGGLVNPNIEKIIELKPDLVITYGSQDVLRERLQAVGVRLFPFQHGNVEQTLKFMGDLGRVVGEEAKAQSVVDEIRKTFEEVRARAPAARPKVMLIHNRGAGVLGSFYSVGSRAFQHDLIEIAGGQNLFRDVDREVLQPSLEEVISRAPDIIIETLPPPLSADEIAQRKKDWQTAGLGKSRVYITDETYMLVPGPRMNLAARKFGEFIRGN